MEFSQVYDVGAAQGSFTRLALDHWPGAKYFLFEPLEEYVATLEAEFAGMQHVERVSLAVWSEVTNLQLNVHKDLYGSSLYKEVEGAFVDGQPRDVATTTLDEFWEAGGGNKLVKIDVQGAELDVLEGASRFFNHQPDAEVVFLLEIGLYETMLNSHNIFDEVIEFFAARDFVLLDIANLMYRPLDGNLMQLDGAFCRKDSVFRKSHAYASHQFRLEQFGYTRDIG